MLTYSYSISYKQDWTFVKADHLPNVRDIQLQTAGVGIGGFVGNKGGVALRFTYGNSSICCVSANHMFNERQVR